ncbi:MAG: glycosyltransferase [Arenicellales bacterium]
MKPLTTGQKKFIYEKLVFGRLHLLAKPVYDLLIGCELGAERGMDMVAGERAGPDDELLDQVTAVVKTFERPRVARRLLASIRRRYPGLRVLVVDDSREPTTFTGVDNLHLPYNSGISVGRNEALDRLDSLFVLILDDDFIFTRRTHLGQAVRTMVDHPEIDIMGGQVVDLPLYVMHDYRRAALFDTGAAPVRPPGSRIAGLPVVEKVPNFFIGRAPQVREVGWNPKLKLLEHADFFSRARGVLTTVMNAELRVLHAKTPFNLKYMRVRHDIRRYQAILHSLYQHRHRGS